MLTSLAFHVRNRSVLARLRGREAGFRILAAEPDGRVLTHSARRINFVVNGIGGCDSYLEIGVSAGQTFEAVRAERRWGVDPAPRFRVDRLPVGTRFSTTTSDDFFGQLPSDTRFDVVFIDGLHEWRQAYRDLLNALNHSDADCIILIDDVVPEDEPSAIPDRHEAAQAKSAAGLTHGHWQGDVYKLMLVVAENHPELSFAVMGSNGPGDNPQAVLWRRDGQIRRYDVSGLSAAATRFDALDYADVFDGGERPAILRSIPESEALDAALDRGAM